MADAHVPVADSDAAPLHQDVRDRFSSWQVALCLILGLAAIAGGIITGIVFANS